MELCGNGDVNAPKLYAIKLIRGFWLLLLLLNLRCRFL